MNKKPKDGRLDIKRVIALNFASGGVAKITSAFVGFISLPIIVSQLGKEKYGVWILASQLLQFFILSDGGISNFIGRVIARTEVNGEKDNTIVTSFYLLLLATALVILSVGVVMPWLGEILNIGPNYILEVRDVILITGIGLAISMPIRLGQGVLSGNQRYELVNFAQVFTSLVYLSVILYLSYSSKITLINLALVSAIRLIALQLIQLILSSRYFDFRILFRPSFFQSGIAKELWSMGGSSLLLTGGSLLYRQGLIISVGHFLSVAEAGIYAVVVTLSTHACGVLTLLPTPLVTLSSQLHASNEKHRVVRTGIAAMKISLFLGLVAFVITLFYGEDFLRILLASSNWSTADFEVAHSCLIVTSFGVAVGLPQLNSRGILQGIGFHWVASRRFFGGAVSSLLLGAFSMSVVPSIISAAFGWSLIWILQGLLLYPGLISKYFEMSVLKMFRIAYGLPILLGLILFVISYAATFLEFSSNLNLIVGIFVNLITAAACLKIVVAKS